MKVLLVARYRYRRSGRRYRNSTRSIMMKFQSFMDISTDVDSMKIITVSAGGREVVSRLMAQFGAYKYYKLGNIAVKLVPASTLPVDPTGLSIDPNSDEFATVDPRDQLTPGMMRITNGEDIFENISGLSDAEQHAIYNNMLLDPRWFKWMLQSGVKRHATPRFWQIGELHQDKWPGAFTNMPIIDSSGALRGTGHTTSHFVGSSSSITSEEVVNRPGSVPYALFQTGHSGRLGWMPTDGLVMVERTLADGGNLRLPTLASPPEVEVMKIILPKAYKTRYYYRMFVTETVYFKEPIVNFGIPGSDGYDYRPLDVFHGTPVSFPRLPITPSRDNEYPTDGQSGGNYGDY